MGEWDSSGLFPPEVACDSSPGMWKLLGLALGFELWMDLPSPSRPTRSLTAFSALFSSWVVLMFCCQARGAGRSYLFFVVVCFAKGRSGRNKLYLSSWKVFLWWMITFSSLFLFQRKVVSGAGREWPKLKSQQTPWCSLSYILLSCCYWIRLLFMKPKVSIFGLGEHMWCVS